MYQLHEAPVHHLLMQGVPRQERHLVSVQLGHRLSRQLTADGLAYSVDKHLHKGVHSLSGSPLQVCVFYLYFYHNGCKDTKKWEIRSDK